MQKIAEKYVKVDVTLETSFLIQIFRPILSQRIGHVRNLLKMVEFSSKTLHINGDDMA